MGFVPKTAIGSGKGGSGKPKTSSQGVQGTTGTATAVTAGTREGSLTSSQKQAEYEQAVQSVQSITGGSSKEAAEYVKSLDLRNAQIDQQKVQAAALAARTQRETQRKEDTVRALSGDPRTEVLQTTKATRTPLAPSNPSNVAYLNPNTRVNPLDLTAQKISMSGAGFKTSTGENVSANINPFLGITTSITPPKAQGLGEKISAYGETLKQSAKDQPTPLLGRIPSSPTATAGSVLKVVGGSVTRAGELKEYAKQSPVKAGAVAGIALGVGAISSFAPPAGAAALNYGFLALGVGTTAYNVAKAPAGKKEEALGASTTDLALFGGLGYVGARGAQSVKVIAAELKPTAITAKGTETKALGSGEVMGKGVLEGTTKGKPLQGTFEVTPTGTTVKGTLGKEPFTIMEQAGQVKTTMYGRTTVTKSPTTDLVLKQVKLFTSTTENVPSVTTTAKTAFRGTGSSTRNIAGDFIRAQGEVTVRGSATTTKTTELTAVQMAQRYSGQPLGETTTSQTTKYPLGLAPEIKPSPRQFLEPDYTQRVKYTYKYVEKPGVKVEKVTPVEKEYTLTFKEFGKKGTLSSGRNFETDFTGRYNTEPSTRTTPESYTELGYASPKVGRFADFGRLVGTLSIARTPTVITTLSNLRGETNLRGGSKSKPLDAVFVAPTSKPFIGAESTPNVDTTPNAISTPLPITISPPTTDTTPKADLLPPSITTSFITTPSPNIPFVDTPLIPSFGFVPPVTSPGGGLGDFKGFGFSPRGQKKQYTSTAFASVFKIKGKETKALSSTGLSVRPIRSK